MNEWQKNEYDAHQRKKCSSATFVTTNYTILCHMQNMPVSLSMDYANAEYIT
jgi:hypothetical protein